MNPEHLLNLFYFIYLFFQGIEIGVSMHRMPKLLVLLGRLFPEPKPYPSEAYICVPSHLLADAGTTLRK